MRHTILRSYTKRHQICYARNSYCVGSRTESIPPTVRPRPLSGNRRSVTTICPSGRSPSRPILWSPNVHLQCLAGAILRGHDVTARQRYGKCILSVSWRQLGAVRSSYHSSRSTLEANIASLSLFPSRSIRCVRVCVCVCVSGKPMQFVTPKLPLARPLYRRRRQYIAKRAGKTNWSPFLDSLLGRPAGAVHFFSFSLPSSPLSRSLPSLPAARRLRQFM